MVRAFQNETGLLATSVSHIGDFQGILSTAVKGWLRLLQGCNEGLHRKPTEENPYYPEKLTVQRQGRQQCYRRIAGQR